MHPLRIAFINDLHAHYEQVPGIKYILNQLNYTLLLNAGDEFTGTPFFKYYGANKSIALLNGMGFDVMTIGNHEFDKKNAYLKWYIDQLEVPVISSNIVDPLVKVKPYTMINGVGIIGSTTPDTKFMSKAEDTEFLPVVPQVNKYAKELKAKGINRIILLSHNGYKEDMLIASQIRDVDVIVGAHSHSLLTNNQTYASDKIEGPYPTTVKDLDGNQVYIVQAKCYGKYVGYFDIEFDQQGIVTHFKGDSIKVDPSRVDIEWQKQIDQWQMPIDKLFNQYLTKSSIELPMDCWRTHCKLGRFVSNAVTQFYLSKRGIDNIPHVAILQSGALRAPIPKGPITLGSIYNLLPFDDFITAALVRGQLIQDAVEGSYIGHIKGRKVTSFLQFSKHMRITILKQKQTKYIVHIRHRTRWQLLDPHKYYRVISSSFVLGGGDNIFPVLMPKPDGLEHVNEGVIAVCKNYKDISVLAK